MTDPRVSPTIRRIPKDPTLEKYLAKKEAERAADISKARVLFSDGRVSTFSENSMALAVWYGLRRGCRAAFRGIGDKQTVYSWDYVDR